MLIHTPQQLAQFYRDQRKVRSRSQSVIAEETGLRQDTVSKFEISPDNSRIDTLFRLLAALDMELHVKPKSAPETNAPETNSDASSWTQLW